MAFDRAPDEAVRTALPVAVAHGPAWYAPKDPDMEPLVWTQDGVQWELTMIRDDGELQWARQRHYTQRLKQCERGGHHLAKPKRWPIKGTRMRVNGVVTEVEGYEDVRCEHCGAHLLVEPSWATPEMEAVTKTKVVLPKGAK